MTVPAESDLYVTPSFSNSAVYRGEVTSASAATVGFTGASFEADEYASGYFLLIEGDSSENSEIDNNPLVGRVFEITGNSATGLTVLNLDTNPDLSGALNETASIVPALTLGEMFPNGVGGKVEVNPGNPDVYLFSNNNSAGVKGLLPKSIYYYGDLALDENDEIVSEPGWRRVGSPLTESRDDDILPLGEGFVVRNNSGLDVSFFLFGEVMLSQVKVPISTSDSGTTDNLVGVPRPLTITIGEMGLDDVVEESAIGDIKDTVRVFPSDSSVKNPAPTAIYCRVSGGWREIVDGVIGDVAVDDTAVIPASSAIVVRKAQAAQSGVVYWSNNWDLPTPPQG